MRVLVIEDDKSLGASLKQLMESQGYACDLAVNGEDGLFCALEYAIDVAIIDIGLPIKNGIEVISELRAAGKTFPVMLLTARDSWQDKVGGLESGADVYLTKPFHSEELVARVNALLRRSVGRATTQLRFASVCLDTASKIFSINQQELSLTSYEYRVLECLMYNAGQVLSKTYLAEHVYDEDIENDSNVIEVFVGRLRKKIKPLYDQELIATVRGQGYRFIAPHTDGEIESNSKKNSEKKSQKDSDNKKSVADKKADSAHGNASSS
jgi:two-component system response regulator PhoP